MTATILATLMALVFSGWVWMLKREMEQQWQILHAQAGAGHSAQHDFASRHIAPHIERHPEQSHEPVAHKNPVVPESHPPSAAKHEGRNAGIPGSHCSRENGVPTWTIT